MRIVTAGSKYLDIDAYAGCVAYTELLQLQGISAQAVSTAALNQSVPKIVRSWGAYIKTAFVPSPQDTFTIVDTSNPDYLDTFVTLDQVVEIIDHHPGFEEFWRERIGAGADIQWVGAACTQVFERWETAGRIEHISETSARLLMCGILDNTLNFGADITTPRDHHAYEVLRQHANLPSDWPAEYFSACQQGIMTNLAQAVADDTKVTDVKTFPHTLILGQVALWDAATVAKQAQAVFKQSLQPVQHYWVMNLISIKDNCSYFVSDVPEVQAWLSKLLGVRFVGNLAAADRSWLRKEIFRADIEQSQSN